MMNQFDPLTTEFESDSLAIPPPPTVNDYVLNAIIKLVGKQAQEHRGRNRNRDPRLKDKVGPTPRFYAGETSRSKDLPPPDVQNAMKISTEEPEQPIGVIINTETDVANNEPTTPKGMGTEADDEGGKDAEASGRQGRTPKKKGDVRRRKTRSKSRTKEGTAPGDGKDGLEDDPGPSP